jgi:PAS domain S-box-containing protein
VNTFQADLRQKNASQPPLSQLAPAHRPSAEHPSQETVATVLETISDGFISLDGNWTLAYVNKAAREMLGAKAIVGRNLWDIFPDMVGTTLEEAYNYAYRDRVAVELEHFYKPWGRWFEVRIYPATGKGLSVFFRDITERKRAAQQLRDFKLALETQVADLRNLQHLNRLNEERFRMAACGDAITLFEQDSDLRYTWLYPQHQQHAGAIGRTDSEILPAPQGTKLEKWKREVMRTGKPQRREIQADLNSNGRCYDVSISARRDHSGMVIGVAGVSLDITERTRAQHASRQLAAIVESSEDAILSEDLSGNITSWNRGAERMFGYTAAEIVGKSIGMLIPGGNKGEQSEILEKVIKGECVSYLETVRCHKDGKLIDVAISISPLRNDSKEIIGASKILRDISERKRRERQDQALFELATRVNRAAAMEDIFEAALDAIMRSQAVDRASILLYDNDGVMRFKNARGLSTDYQRAVEGHSPWDRNAVDPQPVCIENVADINLDKRIRRAVDKEGIRALAFVPITYEGQLLGKFMVYYNSPHRFVESEIRPVQTIATQVAFAIQRQKTEQTLERLVNERTASLREAVQQMEEFSYTISHDLRAPLRGMQVYSEALLEDYSEVLPADGVRYLNRLADNASRLDKMILDVLNFSRIARGDHKMESIDLDKLVREIVHHYPQMHVPNAELDIAKLAGVVGHEPSLTQVISNLLTNAVKFVPKGVTPQVKVWTEKSAGSVKFFVQDNGIGIPEKYQHRLFNMFERVHPELHYEGTGVGLAIVRKAVERMGGSLGLESKPGNGSKFWIKLPAVNTAE